MSSLFDMKTPSICFRFDLNIFSASCLLKDKENSLLFFVFWFCIPFLFCVYAFSYTFPLTNADVQRVGGSDLILIIILTLTVGHTQRSPRKTPGGTPSSSGHLLFVSDIEWPFDPSFDSPSMNFNLICGCDSLRRISVFQFRDFLLAVLLTNTFSTIKEL